MVDDAFQVQRNEAGQRLVDYLAHKRGCSLRKAKALLDQRCVFVNRKRIWMARHVLANGDHVEIRSPAPTRKAPFQVLFENERFLVLGKPPGTLSNGPDSVESAARRQFNQAGLTAVHRLDRDTSGCLLLAKSPQAFEEAVVWFREERVGKIYHAIVWGCPTSQARTIKRPVNGDAAVTHWQVLSTSDVAAHLQIKIDTGRTHQIRKHLSGMDHPILGDRQYFTARQDDKRLRTVPRQMLHASMFQAPLGDDGKVVRVTAPLPDDFKQTLGLFGLR